MHSFKILLKKCPNITSIKLNGPNLRHHNYRSVKFNAVFQLIIANCNNLREIIVCNDIILNESILEEFYQKFGLKIKYLQSFRKLFELNRFPKIEKIIISGFWLDHSIIGDLKQAKLRELDIMIKQGQEHLLQRVIYNFLLLTHFNIYIRSKDENAIYKSLKNISNLKHLIHFKICNQFTYIDNKFYEILKQMANNCQNLKNIECSFMINDYKLEIKQLLSQLRAFPALKRLNLSLNLQNNEEENNFDDQIFSFELFKGFSNITHLSLHFDYTYLKESTLKEIDINLPKLQYLVIKNKFDTTPEGVTQMANILSRLSRLETLKLFFIFEVEVKPIEEPITEKVQKNQKN